MYESHRYFSRKNLDISTIFNFYRTADHFELICHKFTPLLNNSNLISYNKSDFYVVSFECFIDFSIYTTELFQLKAIDK